MSVSNPCDPRFEALEKRVAALEALRRENAELRAFVEAYVLLSRGLDAALTAKPQPQRDPNVGGTARFGSNDDGPEIRDDLPPVGKASRL